MRAPGWAGRFGPDHCTRRYATCSPARWVQLPEACRLSTKLGHAIASSCRDHRALPAQYGCKRGYRESRAVGHLDFGATSPSRRFARLCPARLLLWWPQRPRRLLPSGKFIHNGSGSIIGGVVHAPHDDTISGRTAKIHRNPRARRASASSAGRQFALPDPALPFKGGEFTVRPTGFSSREFRPAPVGADLLGLDRCRRLRGPATSSLPASPDIRSVLPNRTPLANWHSRHCPP